MVAALVVDDVSVFRRLVRAALERDGDIRVIAEAATGDEAVRLYEAHRPDVVTLDFELPDANGAVVLRRLRKLDPEARVLVVTGSLDPARTRELMAAGALGVLHKPIHPPALLEMCRQVATGQRTGFADGAKDGPVTSDRHGRVLVVDDDRLYVRIISRAMEQAGHAVSAVSSGEEAVAVCRHQPPDLVLLDYHLPRADGLSVLGAIRRLSGGTQVVMISGSTDYRMADQARALGALDVLTKPLNYLELGDLVERALHDPRPATERAAGGGTPPRVLIVEDERVTQRILERAVDKAGGEVVALAGSASEAVAELTASEPELVLLDLHLTTGHGFQVLAEMRAAVPQTPVIIVTGRTDWTTVSAAMEFGVVGYIAKPFEIDHLVAVIRKAFDQVDRPLG